MHLLEMDDMKKISKKDRFPERHSRPFCDCDVNELLHKEREYSNFSPDTKFVFCAKHHVWVPFSFIKCPTPDACKAAGTHGAHDL